jgi:hypothetical protein
MSGAFDALPRDYKDLLRLLKKHDAAFMVVGGWAMAAHGHPRSTKDLDIFVDATPDNARRVYRALAEFGAPLRDVVEADFAEPGVIFQIGVGFRIDIATVIDGVSFADIVAERIDVEMDGLLIPVIGRDALRRNKQAADRDQDRADVEQLQKLEAESGLKPKAP